MDPLGPLGVEAAEEPAAPTPPAKELASRTRQPAAARPGTAASGRSSIRSGDGTNESASLNGSARIPPPVQPPQFDDRPRASQPSVSVEQAAKPTFTITVGDPHTVGGATSSHTVYSVITRTTSKAYNTPTFTVQRRYRDFLWLYERLHDNSPGVVVPPPPEKQAVGRFDTNFIESRRMALERMLNKTAAHPVLQHDGDLKTFLESDAFNVDIKHKDRGKDPLLASENSGGFMSSLGLGGNSGGGKFIEHDDWFHDRKVYLDALENQLKALQKSTDTVIAQRKALAESCGDFSVSLHQLASVERSPSLSGPLDALGDLQMRIQELYQRQAMQDMLTLGIVIEEYIRLISSVQKSFHQRQRAFHAWHSAESKLAEVKKSQDKLLRAGRSQQDRLAQMQADVADQERKVHAARLLFEDMGRLMRGELERFEREKVEDFKSGVETFLEGAVEAQKEVRIVPWRSRRTCADTHYSSSNSGRRISSSWTATRMARRSCLPASRLRQRGNPRHRSGESTRRPNWKQRTLAAVRTVTRMKERLACQARLQSRAMTACVPAKTLHVRDLREKHMNRDHATLASLVYIALTSVHAAYSISQSKILIHWSATYLVPVHVMSLCLFAKPNPASPV